jgi:hypothetical protein
MNSERLQLRNQNVLKKTGIRSMNQKTPSKLLQDYSVRLSMNSLTCLKESLLKRLKTTRERQLRREQLQTKRLVTQKLLQSLASKLPMMLLLLFSLHLEKHSRILQMCKRRHSKWLLTLLSLIGILETLKVMAQNQIQLLKPHFRLLTMP